jgi:hypothetical protein
MALNALPSAFITRVCKASSRVPFFTPRHLTELSLYDAPKPDELQEPRLWGNARTRSIRASLKTPHDEGKLDSTRVNLGKIFPVEGPFFSRSTTSGPEMDVAACAERLNGRPVDRNLHDDTNIYYSLNENPAVSGTREELKEYFFGLTFIQNKALAQATSIYLHLLRTEPTVAETYRFHPTPPAPLVRFDDILADYRELLDRHWIRGGPETESCIIIDRGAGPVRVLYFVRPIPADALGRIGRRFEQAGQLFELW